MILKNRFNKITPKTMKIFDSRKNIAVASIGVLLVAMTLVSCEKRDDYYGRKENGYSETINFSVVDPMMQTRNHRGLAKVDNEAIDYKTVLRSSDSSDSLHLTAYVSDMNTAQNLTTRASAFTTNNLADFIVYGYNSTAQTFDYSDNFISGGIAKKQTNGTWRFNPDVNWPAGNSDFFAIANNDANSSVTVLAGDNQLPTIRYVVPDYTFTTEEDGTQTPVDHHKDVVVARSGIQATNTANVPLEFKHIFTAVQFKFGEIKKDGQIHSISISGVHLDGSLNLGYESNSGFMAMNAWSYNDNKERTFTLPFGDNANITSDNDGASIGTLENGYAIMMIPQTLAGAKLKIGYTPDGAKEGTIITMEANLIGTWEVGKIVTYTISISEILDLWFNNTTEICLDAHYVMDNKLSVHIGDDVIADSRRDSWSLSSNAEWLTVKRTLTDLQTDGWWIIEDKGTTSLTSQTDKGDFNIWLIAEENASNEARTATITLSSSKGTFKTFTVTQMCPHWIDIPGTATTPAKRIGAEKIEEYPQRVPWGNFWKLKDGISGDDGFTITYKTSEGGLFSQATIERIWAAILHYFAGGNEGGGVTYKYGNNQDSYIFDYSNIANTVLDGTSSGDDGLFNTTNGYSNAVLGTTTLKDYLFEINPENSQAVMNFDEYTPVNSAFVNSLKKNRFHFLEKDDSGQTGRTVDIDRAKNENEIVWYLPAKNEAISGVYQENTDLHSCETAFDPLFDNDQANDSWGTIFWTSSSVDGTSDQAWTYDFSSNTTLGAPKNEGKEENNTTGYRVRAIRKSN